MPGGSRAQGGVFISYRRSESAYASGWLFDRLAARFGVERVFKDVDGIQPGDDFVQVIDAALGSCSVVLAVIGPLWSTVADDTGRRRLDDPHDFVAQEIAAALQRGIRLVPVLVDGAGMPSAADLPDRLAGLANRQALELRPDRFASDAGHLIELLASLLGVGGPDPGSGSGPGSRAAPDPPVDTLALPPPVLFGRDSDLARLREAVGDAARPASPIVVLHGSGGVGKTALARAFAVEVSDLFGDGRFEVDLAGYTPGAMPRDPGEVLGDLLTLAGFAPTELPASTSGRSELWRSWSAERRVLLLLDNARDAAQVAPLLPGGRRAGRCLVLVTSRRNLVELDRSVSFLIDTLSQVDAVALLVSSGRRARSELAGTESDLAALAATCGQLPLALRTVGALLAHLEPPDLVGIMAEGQHPFDHLPEVEHATAAAFDVSYEALSPPQQQALRACVWHPGPDFDARSVAALAGRPPAAITVQLAGLLDANMLSGLPGHRFTFHDVHRDHAMRRAMDGDGDASARAARSRFYGDLQERLDASAALVYPDNGRIKTDRPVTVDPAALDQARRWLSGAAGELITAATTAIEEAWTGATELGVTLAYWLHAGGRSDQARSLARSVLAAAEAAGDLTAQANALEGLGLYTYAVGEPAAARAAYQQGLQCYEQLGDRRGQAVTLEGLGDVARVVGDLTAAESLYRRSHDAYAEAGHQRGQAAALTGLADTAFARGDLASAHDSYRQAYEEASAVGYSNGQADALCGVGDIAIQRNEGEQARRAFEQAGSIFRQTSNRHGLAYALKGLADAARIEGDRPAAADLYRRALALYEQIGFRHCEAEVLQGLGEVARAEGQPDAAAELYHRALAVWEQLEHVGGQIEALTSLAALAAARGATEEAAELRTRMDELTRHDT